MALNRGKQFEQKLVVDWKNTMPDSSLDRLYDTMNGYKSITNISDFIGYSYPNIFYLECKTHKGASIPFEMRVLFDRFCEDKKAMYEIGIAYSVNQILELLANDADGIHLYTMNNAQVTNDIYSRIENVIERELR